MTNETVRVRECARFRARVLASEFSRESLVESLLIMGIL